MKKKKMPSTLLKTFENYSEQFKKLEMIKEDRQRCWEYMNCPENVYTNCPVYLKFAGRRCWLIAGTLGEEKSFCIFTKTLKSCKHCDFYNKIKRSEI
ncbi:two component signal transduction response regulator [Candidatus Magnetoovum chiemensis]|nr:two component signal transduction response regulator [Candidatus Magnetoovum chiemensis]